MIIFILLTSDYFKMYVDKHFKKYHVGDVKTW